MIVVGPPLSEKEPDSEADPDIMSHPTSYFLSAFVIVLLPTGSDCLEVLVAELLSGRLIPESALE